jgi:hypothetical protein
MSVIGCKQGLLGSTKTPLLFKVGCHAKAWRGGSGRAGWFSVDTFGNSNKCYTIPSFVQGIVEKENDGVVTAAAQTAYPGAKKIIRMDDTNHMQERNCEETKRVLKKLFDGDYNDQFLLNEK